MPVMIRSAVSDDVDAILALEQEASGAAHWTREQYRQRVGEGTILVAEAEEEGSLTGFLCARIVAGEWEIENVAVAEKARRRGVAGRLLEELLRRARSLGAIAVWLEVRESNQPARHLYEKHGFKEAGWRPAYYRNPDEDALLYRFV